MVGEYSCRNLLREMELASFDDEEEDKFKATENLDDMEMLTLPAEWIDLGLGEESQEEQTEEDIRLPSKSCIENMDFVDQGITQEVMGQSEPRITTKKFKKVRDELIGAQKQWGPVLVEGRPRRQKNDGKSMLERAQELKEKRNLKCPYGKPTNPFSVLSEPEIRTVSSVVGIRLGKSDSSSLASVHDIQLTNYDRNKALTENCKTTGCNDLLDKGISESLSSVESDQWDHLDHKVEDSMEWTIVANRKSYKKIKG